MVVFAQEILQDKGVIQGIMEGDRFNIAAAVGTLLAMASISAFFFADLKDKAPASQGSDPKPHPSKDFKFKSVTKSLIKSYRDAGDVKKERKEPVMPISAASAFPVQGFNFKSDVKTMIKKEDATPHPSGKFRFQNSVGTITAPENVPKKTILNEPRANVNPWPVQGFKFSGSTQSVIKEVESAPQNQLSSFLRQDESAITAPTALSTTVDVLSAGSGKAMNTAPRDNAVSSSTMQYGGSYLEALSGSALRSPEKTSGDDTTNVAVSSRARWAAPSRGSYLDSLNSSTMLKATPNNAAKDDRAYVNWRD